MYTNAMDESNRVKSILTSICLTSKVNICSEVELDLVEQLWQLILLLYVLCPLMGSDVSLPYYVNDDSMEIMLLWNDILHGCWNLRA